MGRINDWERTIHNKHRTVWRRGPLRMMVYKDHVNRWQVLAEELEHDDIDVMFSKAFSKKDVAMATARDWIKWHPAKRARSRSVPISEIKKHPRMSLSAKDYVGRDD